MFVRPYELSDFEKLVELGTEVHGISSFSHLPIELHKLEDLSHACINYPDTHVCFVLEHDGEVVGLLAGYACEEWFGRSIMSSDYLFYVRPNSRGGSGAFRLMHAFIEWSKLVGSKTIIVGARTGILVDQTSRFYNKMGFDYTCPLMTKRI